MQILFASGPQGLLHYTHQWQRIPCPLASPTLLAAAPHRLAAASPHARLLWTGHALHSIDPGVEKILFWRDLLLILSGDADCLSLFSPSSALPLLTLPVGVYPQDMCLLGARLLAVCGGADGQLHLIRLPQCRFHRSISLPGTVQRVAFSRGDLFVLCTVEASGLQTQLYRLPPPFMHAEYLAHWPGLSGALHGDEQGSLWIAASETLCRLSPGCAPIHIPGDFGLIRHMSSRSGVLLVTDPVLDLLSLVQSDRQRILVRENVHHGLLL